jgi:hypothetical protein
MACAKAMLLFASLPGPKSPESRMRMLVNDVSRLFANQGVENPPLSDAHLLSVPDSAYPVNSPAAESAPPGTASEPQKQRALPEGRKPIHLALGEYLERQV